MRDYKELGFKCGLEIHQQLETHKLFCNCPSIVHDEDPDIHVERRLRAVAGENEKVDQAAKHEMAKGKKFIYEACSTSSCLVELDEEPPHSVNMEALKIVIQIAKMLNAKIVDQIQFMRKTVIDGSNVSGFQRTGLIAMDGYVETSKGKVGIPLICLEEEAAQKIETTEKYVKYRLDRLGVPLIEVATDATIKDPEHAKEVAEKIGMVLRSTKVKRGIGTIRQDVNVSIKGGARTEIKGFQDLKSIPKVIDYEVNRQLEEIKKGKKINQEVRKAEPDFTTKFLRPMPGADRMYPETDVPKIEVTKEILDVEIPELLDEKIKKVAKKYDLEEDIVKKLIRMERLELFEKYHELKSNFVADVLLGMEKQIKKKYGKEINISDENFKLVFENLKKGKISKESLIEILKEEKIDLSKYELMDDNELKKEIMKIIKENKGIPFNALIGKAMGKLRGKADGKKIVDMLKSNV